MTEALLHREIRPRTMMVARPRRAEANTKTITVQWLPNLL
jgi:hypothetical protein